MRWRELVGRRTATSPPAAAPRAGGDATDRRNPASSRDSERVVTAEGARARKNFQPEAPLLSALVSAARVEENRRTMLEGRGRSSNADGVHFF
jgi:hypothetical protein